MPCTLYKYSGKSIYTMYLDLKCFKSHLTYEKEYIDDNIEEMSLYELDHVAFMYPLFSGKYFVDYDLNTITFSYYCYSNTNDKKKEFDMFLTKWEPKNMLSGLTVLLDSIMSVLRSIDVKYESHVEQVNFECDENELELG